MLADDGEGEGTGKGGGVDIMDDVSDDANRRAAIEEFGATVREEIVGTDGNGGSLGPAIEGERTAVDRGAGYVGGRRGFRGGRGVDGSVEEGTLE